MKLDISQEPDYTVGILASAEGEMEPSTKLAHVAQDSIVWLAGSTLYSVVVLISLATLPPAEEPDHKLQYVQKVMTFPSTLSSEVDQHCADTDKNQHIIRNVLW